MQKLWGRAGTVGQFRTYRSISTIANPMPRQQQDDMSLMLIFSRWVRAGGQVSRKSKCGKKCLQVIAINAYEEKEPYAIAGERKARGQEKKKTCPLNPANVEDLEWTHCGLTRRWYHGIMLSKTIFVDEVVPDTGPWLTWNKFKQFPVKYLFGKKAETKVSSAVRIRPQIKSTLRNSEDAVVLDRDTKLHTDPKAPQKPHQH
ncbi:hypothetical protein Q9233_014505 [Columba guinea]|nr:hypothetical protein Q9233_014505 [Columba guinea]